jgi:signal peptidase II
VNELKSKQNIINKKALLWYIICAAVLTAADQLSKVLAVSHLMDKNAFVIIKDVFEFSYLENSGAAWGMMNGARIFFLILTIVIVLLITWVVIRMPKQHKYIPLQITAILLCAGALGNFIDRLFLGYVRDFIYFKLINFPIFNVADSYVTVAVILFAILILFVYKENDFEFIKRNKHD